jgi:hypothetical protein
MKLTLIALSLCLLGISWLLTSTYTSALMLQKEYTAALESRHDAYQSRTALCAKKASNFAYIIDKKLYSEESAQRIYQTCLNEL